MSARPTGHHQQSIDTGRPSPLLSPDHPAVLKALELTRSHGR